MLPYARTKHENNFKYTFMKKYFYFIAALTLFLPALSSCDDGNEVSQDTETVVDSDSGISSTDSIQGFYLLNEGQSGQNNASLDYYNYATGTYSQNKFGTVNSNASIGDIGNDIEIYGNKLYVVVNGSNMVQVLDATTCKQIKKISIPNCRNITFYKGKAYVSSYAGTLNWNNSNNRLGYVARVDTAELSVSDTCNVGYQPEQMAIYGGKLYVANSGGFMPTYDNRVSVINLNTFKKEKDITVNVNLNKMLISKENELFVSTNGDYYYNTSKLYVINPTTDAVTDSINVSVSGMSKSGDSIYVYGAEFSYLTYKTTISYHIINSKTHAIVSSNIITDGTSISSPYMIKVNPVTKEIFIADAGNYSSPGKIYCFNSKGVLKWSHEAGVAPAHMVFTKFKL